mgnify:CR=1 FL=1
MSLISDVFSPTKDNGRFKKHKKCKYCDNTYINKKNFCDHQNNCNNYYKKDDFITDKIIYESKKSPKKLSNNYSNKTPKRSPRRIIYDDEDKNIKKKGIIEPSEIIEDGEIIEDRNNINNKKNNDNIINKNIDNKLISKRKRTETIFIKKHKYSNGLEIDPNFYKTKSDKYFKYNDKDIISFDNKKIIINIQNINKLTINL